MERLFDWTKGAFVLIVLGGLLAIDEYARPDLYSALSGLSTLFVAGFTAALVVIEARRDRAEIRFEDGRIADGNAWISVTNEGRQDTGIRDVELSVRPGEIDFDRLELVDVNGDPREGLVIASGDHVEICCKGIESTVISHGMDTEVRVTIDPVLGSDARGSFSQELTLDALDSEEGGG